MRFPVCYPFAVPVLCGIVVCCLCGILFCFVFGLVSLYMCCCVVGVVFAVFIVFVVDNIERTSLQILTIKSGCVSVILLLHVFPNIFDSPCIVFDLV